MRLLGVIEGVFAIKDRGVVVAPDVDLGDGPARDVTIELRRPDATTARVEARAEVPFLSPPRISPRARHVLRFMTLTKADLPVGTELWLVDGDAE